MRLLHEKHTEVKFVFSEGQGVRAGMYDRNNSGPKYMCVLGTNAL